MIKILMLSLSFFISETKADCSLETYYLNPIDTLKKETVEELIQRQLDAYNNRDIDAFMATYSKDITLYAFPETITSKGQEDVRSRYTVMFENTPDLFCEIKKRIVIGNKVIDHEYVKKNGAYINAVAIYEVENGLISKVTFIK